MPGPPPKPAHLKLLQGNPGKKRIPPEVQPEIPATIPEPPAFLSGPAADEWRRIAPELYFLRLLTDLDLQVLAAYCKAYARWRACEEALAVMGQRGDLNALLIRGERGDPRINPLLRIARNAADDMVTFAGHFGLSPAARARIGAGITTRPPGKFDGLIV